MRYSLQNTCSWLDRKSWTYSFGTSVQTYNNSFNPNLVYDFTEEQEIWDIHGECMWDNSEIVHQNICVVLFYAPVPNIFQYLLILWSYFRGRLHENHSIQCTHEFITYVIEKVIVPGYPKLITAYVYANMSDHPLPFHEWE